MSSRSDSATPPFVIERDPVRRGWVPGPFRIIPAGRAALRRRGITWRIFSIRVETARTHGVLTRPAADASVVPASGRYLACSPSASTPAPARRGTTGGSCTSTRITGAERVDPTLIAESGDAAGRGVEDAAGLHLHRVDHVVGSFHADPTRANRGRTRSSLSIARHASPFLTHALLLSVAPVTGQVMDAPSHRFGAPPHCVAQPRRGPMIGLVQKRRDGLPPLLSISHLAIPYHTVGTRRFGLPGGRKVTPPIRRKSQFQGVT